MEINLKRAGRLAGIGFIILGFGWMGCEDNTVDSLTQAEDEIMELLQNDETLQLDGFGDDGANDLDYESGLEDGTFARTLGDTLWPENDDYRIRFGRRISSIDMDADITVDEDAGTAIADVNRAVTGNFIVVALDSNHAVVDSFVKPFESNFHRKVRFIHRPAPNDSVSYREGRHRHWRVDAMTIGAGVTGTKVALEQLDMYIGDADTAAYSFTADEAGEVFLEREDIPTFEAWTPIRIVVTVSNAGPEFPFRSGEQVVYHFGRGPQHKGRRLLFDENQDGEYDNVFERTWLIPGPGPGFNHRIFGGFYDVIDFGTLFAEDEAVHANVWAFPFRPHRPGHRP